jgi:hypothetical protein
MGVAVGAFSRVGVGAIVGVSVALAAAKGTTVGVGSARPIGRSQPVTNSAVIKSAMTKRVRLFISLFSNLYLPHTIVTFFGHKSTHSPFALSLQEVYGEIIGDVVEGCCRKKQSLLCLAYPAIWQRRLSPAGGYWCPVRDTDLGKTT